MSKRWHAVVGSVLVLAWLGVAAATGPLAGRLGEVQTNDQASFLPATAESTEVAAVQRRFSEQQDVPAVVVLARSSGVTPADQDWATGIVRGLGREGVRAGGPIPSRDGKAIEILVPVTGDQEAITAAVDDLRQQLDTSRPAGLSAYVTGPAGFTADLSEAFAGIDGVLLLVALAVVLLILLAVYRSPILPIAVLLTSVFALSLASGVVYVLADHGLLTLNGQSQGILSILVVGAATDYALLLTARYREELREHESRFAAMRTALRQSAAPILASGMTVILALLCLLVSDLNSTRSLGPVAAIGIAGALLAALTFLPAVLALLGRAAFWPRRPALGSPHPEHSGVWAKVAGLVRRRPRTLWIATGLGLAVLAGFAGTLRADGTSQSEVFLHEQPSVTGQQVAARHFPGGTGSPAVVIGPADQRQRLVDTARGVPGVSSADALSDSGRPGGQPKVVDGLVQVQAVLTAPADSEAALRTVERLRTAVHDTAPGAKVGGESAVTLDTRVAAEHDRSLVIPLVLLMILLLLAILLRAVVAAVLLLATVVLSFAATMGVSALVFNHLFGFPGADPSVPLYGFVFLVALGVDYNIFLMTRAREESRHQDTSRGVLTALVLTGGVITSAGVVLAATFSALSVIPLLFLAQIAFIVGFGVLLDTFVVRSLLVPAAALDLGDRLWWPSRPASGRRNGGDRARARS